MIRCVNYLTLNREPFFYSRIFLGLVGPSGPAEFKEFLHIYYYYDKKTNNLTPAMLEKWRKLMRVTIIRKSSSGVNFLEGGFTWDMTEDFTELRNLNKEWQLTKTSAKHIMDMNILSTQSKILLSAVAGAAIQYLIDNKKWTDVNRLYMTIREES